MAFNEIIVGDCISNLRRISNSCAQIAFADPPFNLEKNYTTYSDSKENLEYQDWCEDWIGQLVRILKPGGSLFLHNIPKWLATYTCMLARHDSMQFRHWIAWDAPTRPMGKSLQPAHYGILYYVKSPVTNLVFEEIRLPHKRCRNCNTLIADYGGKKETIPPHGPLASDVWKDIHRLKHKKYRNAHPCQLPVPLLERLVLMASEADDLVVDPFMGTGTTAIAAKRLGRNFLGFEIDKDYVSIANQRLDQQVVISKFNGLFVGCQRNEIISVRSQDADSIQWQELFETWPKTDDEKRQLNTVSLGLKPVYKQLLKTLELQLQGKEKEKEEKEEKEENENKNENDNKIE